MDSHHTPRTVTPVQVAPSPTPARQAPCPPLNRGAFTTGHCLSGPAIGEVLGLVTENCPDNFSRNFALSWEEMAVPVRFGADCDGAGAILIEAATRHTAEIVQKSANNATELQRRFDLPNADVRPRVYLTLTTDWSEFMIRFLARTRGVLELKDAISREVLDGFDAAGIAVASKTFVIVRDEAMGVESSLSDSG